MSGYPFLKFVSWGSRRSQASGPAGEAIAQEFELPPDARVPDGVLVLHGKSADQRRVALDREPHLAAGRRADPFAESVFLLGGEFRRRARPDVEDAEPPVPQPPEL